MLGATVPGLNGLRGMAMDRGYVFRRWAKASGTYSGDGTLEGDSTSGRGPGAGADGPITGPDTALSETGSGVAGYYRDPALRSGLLVFASEGDLWRVPAAGGAAVRLTGTVEEVSDPALSPDGRRVAFTARHRRVAQVHVMPVEGGLPRQLTFGTDAYVRGWTPDGRILFANDVGPSPLPAWLSLVDPNTGAIEAIPFDGAPAATVAPDGTYYITRYSLSQFGDNAVLYRGGLMAQLWRYKPATMDEAERLIPDFDGPVHHPMWWQGRIVFITDQSGADNIWSLDPESGDLRQHSDFEGWELRGATIDGNEIVYQRGADLYRYDLAEGRETRIPVTLTSSRDQCRPRYLDASSNDFERAHLGPDKDRAVCTVRGRVALAFTGERRRIELDIPPHARARGAVISADGKAIFVILDQDRFGQIWRYSADGKGEPEQLTQDCDAHIWSLHPSPDGNALLFHDKKNRLWSLDLESLDRTLMETSEGGFSPAFGGVTWSQAGRYLAYSVIDRRHVERIVLRDLEEDRREVVTTAKFRSLSPSFSPDGKWLYFISDRHFAAAVPDVLGDRAMGTAFDNRSELFALQLVPGTRFPFEREDELSLTAGKKPDDDQSGNQDKTDDPAKDAGGETSDKPDSKGKDDGGSETESTTPKDQYGDQKDSKKQPDPEIEFDGLSRRLWKVPIGPDTLVDLAVSSRLIYVLSKSNGASRLLSIPITDRTVKVNECASSVRHFELSDDRKTLLVQTFGNLIALAPTPDVLPEDLSDLALRTFDWSIRVDPREEWRQMQLDAWRLHREYSFDPRMRGVDWDAVLDQYLPLVERIGHRLELDDLLGRMIAALGLLHSQIIPGERAVDFDDGMPAFLGAEFEPDPDGLRLSVIYRGERDRPATLGPLDSPKSSVREGDVLTAVDGRPVRNDAELSLALRTKADQEVRLDLKRDEQALSLIVNPVGYGHNTALRYSHWIECRREVVRTLSNGRIGYLHLYAMGDPDLGTFARDFFEHVDKDGIIIDVRGNRGGNVSSALLHVLMRRIWTFYQWRLGGPVMTDMPQTFRGHLAVLCDQSTYSDGEYFTAGAKAFGLGPVIGTRTAGAAVGLNRSNRIIDGGVASIGEVPAYGLDGEWLIEGSGVEPTMEVINPPVATFSGGDAQLEAAIRSVLERMESDPVPPLEPAPLPPLGKPGKPG